MGINTSVCVCVQSVGLGGTLRFEERLRLIHHAWLEVSFLFRFHYKVRPEAFGG